MHFVFFCTRYFLICKEVSKETRQKWKQTLTKYVMAIVGTLNVDYQLCSTGQTDLCHANLIKDKILLITLKWDLPIGSCRVNE